MKIVLNLIRLLLCFCLILLQACQQKIALNTEHAIQAEKKKEAASFNTELGLTYLKQGDRPRAKRKLLTALDLAPDSAEVNVAMAYYLEKTGDIKKAHNFYLKALSLAPDSGAQLNNYGTFLCRQGQYKDAEGYFLKALKDIHYVHTAKAYENAGLCAAAIPDYTKARKYFVKALEQDPHQKQSLYELVVIEIKQNNANQALTYLQKYPELTMNDSTLLGLAARAAQRTGKVEVEAAYKKRLSRLHHFTDHTGAKNEYDSNNG